MNHIRFAFLVAVVMLAGCASQGGWTEQDKAVFIKQGDRMIKLEELESSLTLNPAPFSIVFTNRPYNFKAKQFYAAQIGATKNKAAYDPVTEGQSSGSVPFFRLGTGMAAGEGNRYTSLILNDEGHHYLGYGENNDTRLNLIKRKANGLLELEFPIEQISDGSEMPVSEIAGRELYLLIYMDRNLNNTIDRGELRKVILQF